MGQPTPPGDIPLYDGLGAEWNDIVGAFPEDKRAELAPLLQQRISGYEEKVKPWEDLSKSGITPDQATMAVDLYTIIEQNPRQVYDTLAKHLGITTQEAKEVVQEAKDSGVAEDPRIDTMKKQIDVLTQITLAQRQQETEASLQAQAEAEIDAELTGLKKKYGDDLNEDEIIMRMVHKDMTAEQAYQDYTAFISNVRKSRPAPMLIGQGNAVPRNAIDPVKLDSKGTKNLVAQMMERAALQDKQ